MQLDNPEALVGSLHKLDAASRQKRREVRNLVLDLGSELLKEIAQFEEHGQVELLLEVLALVTLQGTSPAAQAHEQLQVCQLHPSQQYALASAPWCLALTACKNKHCSRLHY